MSTATARELDKEIRESIVPALAGLVVRCGKDDHLMLDETSSFEWLDLEHRLVLIRRWATSNGYDGLAVLASAAEDLVAPDMMISFPFDPEPFLSVMRSFYGS